jgi:preprotein translocase subunit YajC
MMSWSGLMVILAADAAPAADQGFSPLLQMAPFILIAVLFFVTVLMPKSKDQKNRLAQLANMKKNDRVFTSSGIIGTIANISADGKEVTLKIDDNAKIRVFRRAIEGFYADSTSTDATPPA